MNVHCHRELCELLDALYLVKLIFGEYFCYFDSYRVAVLLHLQLYLDANRVPVRERVNKGLKASDEQKNKGQHCTSSVMSCRPGILIYQAPMPLLAHSSPREARHWLQSRWYTPFQTAYTLLSWQLSQEKVNFTMPWPSFEHGILAYHEALLHTTLLLTVFFYSL